MVSQEFGHQLIGPQEHLKKATIILNPAACKGYDYILINVPHCVIAVSVCLCYYSYLFFAEKPIICLRRMQLPFYTWLVWRLKLWRYYSVLCPFFTLFFLYAFLNLLIVCNLLFCPVTDWLWRPGKKAHGIDGANRFADHCWWWWDITGGIKVSS